MGMTEGARADARTAMVRSEFRGTDYLRTLLTHA